MEKCKHNKLAFASGGYYIQCQECTRWWVAKKLGAPSDVDLGYDAAYDGLTLDDIRVNPTTNTA